MSCLIYHVVWTKMYKTTNFCLPYELHDEEDSTILQPKKIGTIWWWEEVVALKCKITLPAFDWNEIRQFLRKILEKVKVCNFSTYWWIFRVLELYQHFSILLFELFSFFAFLYLRFLDFWIFRFLDF